MLDREKVIKAFEICDNNEDGIVCKNCPYKEDKWNGAWEDETGRTCFQTLHADALALLKEQTHGETFTVIDTKTGKEADTYNIALHEDWAKHLCYCDMEGWAIEDDGTLLLVDECGRFEYADRERFKVKWDA